MSERLSDIQNNTVTWDTYEDGLNTRADTDMLTSRWKVCKGDANPNRLMFPRRLLTHSGLEQDYAVDDIVRVAGVDNLTDEESGPILLSVRPIIEDGTEGSLEHMNVSADGIILNKNENTPNIELGYLVGVSGIDDDELRTTAAVPAPLKHLDAEVVRRKLSFEEEQEERSI